ncbi:MAG: hypothetical protein AAF714_08960 [Pseudomonadota bacterium]
MKEISDITSFEAWVKKTPECKPAAIQDLDLTKQGKLITGKQFPNSIFLSCDMDTAVAGHIVQTGGVVIPDLKGFKFQVHRKSLYTVNDLFDGFDINNPKGYESTYDFKVYKEYYCYVDYWKDRAGLPASKLLAWIGLAATSFTNGKSATELSTIITESSHAIGGCRIGSAKQLLTFTIAIRSKAIVG